MPKRPMQWEGSGDVRMFSQLRSMSETWSPPPQYTVTTHAFWSGGAAVGEEKGAGEAK